MAAAGGCAAANPIDAKLLPEFADGVEVVRFDQPGSFHYVLHDAQFLA
jgi:hypothetical protein